MHTALLVVTPAPLQRHLYNINFHKCARAIDLATDARVTPDTEQVLLIDLAYSCAATPQACTAPQPQRHPADCAAAASHHTTAPTHAAPPHTAHS